MADRIIARWATASGDGVQHLALSQGELEIVAEGMAVSDRDEPFAVHYRIACDPAWRIQRLDPGVGESVDIDPVYVSFPDLSVFADPQRYTCLEYRRRYRFESRDSDFVREITVDENGLVVDYPGLFRRIL
jgi:uncharacterized protein